MQWGIDETMHAKFTLYAMALALLANPGCSQRLPLEEAGVAADSYSASLSPLDLRKFEVATSASGHRGVFLHLSRFPEAIAHAQHSNPARIVIDISGPTGIESAEETFPGGDSLVSMVRVTRNIGQLRIVLDLAGADPPGYTIHRMGDWVMVRLRPPA